MGILCCNKSVQPVSAATAAKVDSVGPLEPVKVQEKEVNIPTYSSGADKEFSKLETKFNLLRDLVFGDYIYSLSIFSTENATLVDDYNKIPEKYSISDPFYNEAFPPELIQSFIENKIFKHPNLYSKAGEDEQLANTFKEMILQIQKNLTLKIKQNKKNKGEPDDDSAFKKSHAAALGLLYCSGQNVSKIKFLFDLFAVNGVLKISKELDDFLLGLFLIPAYCMLAVRSKIHKTNSEIEELPKDGMKQLLDACELKDSAHLVDVTNGILFPTPDKQYTYEQFKALFQKGDNSIGWLLSAKGVRSMLEKNNV